MGRSFVKPFQAFLALANTLSFKLPKFLRRVWYVCTIWKVNRRPSGILGFASQRVSQAIISSRTSSRSSFTLQCQHSVVSLSNSGNESRSQSSLPQNKKVLWFYHLQMRNWDVRRSGHRGLIWICSTEVQWIGELLPDICTSLELTVWWQSFLHHHYPPRDHPKEKAIDGSNRRQRMKFLHHVFF